MDKIKYFVCLSTPVDTWNENFIMVIEIFMRIPENCDHWTE